MTKTSKCSYSISHNLFIQQQEHRYLDFTCILKVQNPSFLILTNESIFKNSEEIRIDMTFAGSKRQQTKKFGFFTWILLVISHPSLGIVRIYLSRVFYQSTHYYIFQFVECFPSYEINFCLTSMWPEHNYTCNLLRLQKVHSQGYSD